MDAKSIAFEQEQTISVIPSGAALGADIVGYDMRRAPTSEQLEIIEKAWADHLVLRFRGLQGLTLDQLINFSRSLGPLDKRPIRGTINGGAQNDLPPEITVISNILVEGKPIGGLGAYEADWHSDMTYKEIPPKASCLFSVEIPASGGDTSFLNMYKAYEELSDELKQRIASLQCVHDASRNSTGELRQGFKDVSDPRQTVGVVHDIVRIHPVTGKKCLFLGRRLNAYVVGLPLEESEVLLNELWEQCTRSALRWTQIWKLGDAILWDNRCTMHQRQAFDPNSRRLMYRTQIAENAVA